MAAAEDVVVLDRGNGTSVTVHLHGATVLSWKCKGQEMIFVSEEAIYNNKKAIRGGIPVVFPCFGPWELGPQHGFTRISRWALEQPPSKDADGNVVAILTFVDNADTRKMWDKKFKLTYILKVSEESFQMNFKVNNNGDSSFGFTCLLHTYFRVPDVQKATVAGLKGLTYVDKVKGGERCVENRDLLRVDKNVDTVYENAPDVLEINNASGGRQVTIAKTNFPDTVVWNPWTKATDIGDMGDNEYSSMLCVEVGHVAKPKELAPGEMFQASQKLTCKL